LGTVFKLAEWALYSLDMFENFIFNSSNGEMIAQASWLAGDLFTGLAILMVSGGLASKASKGNKTKVTTDGPPIIQ